MSDVDALLFANEAFYRAFADRDRDAMDAIWGDREPIVCIHPGWDLLSGRDEVMQSWAAIMGNPNSPDIGCHATVAHSKGDVGVVICYEELDGQFLLATNMFVRDGRLWKLIHHQSGPTEGRPPPPEETQGPERWN